MVRNQTISTHAKDWLLHWVQTSVGLVSSTFCYHLGTYNEDFILFDGYGYTCLMVFIRVYILCHNFHTHVT